MYQMVHFARSVTVKRSSDATRARREGPAAARRDGLRRRRTASTDLSLRGSRPAIGTSHRMLIYHFGSKEELLDRGDPRGRGTATRRRLADLDVDPRRSRRARSCGACGSTSPTRRCGRTSGCSSRCTARRCKAAPHTVDFLDGIVDSWLEPIAAIRVQHGVSPGVARAQARVDLAVTRGLLLDLLATGDRAGVNAAMEQYSALCDAGTHAATPRSRRKA